ncbi:hypothetical protein B0H13DRAFT_2336935 [Mycena leptocephala]|nr:hypothetical protein B0H13DRAFT_2336935 [Mycena leptocephala]
MSATSRTRPHIRRARCRPRRVVFARADEHEHKSILPLHPEAGTTPSGHGKRRMHGIRSEALSHHPSLPVIPSSPKTCAQDTPDAGDPAHRPIPPREHQAARGTGHPVTYRSRAAAKRQRSASPSLLRVQLAPHTTLRAARILPERGGKATPTPLLRRRERIVLAQCSLPPYTPTAKPSTHDVHDPCCISFCAASPSLPPVPRRSRKNKSNPK